MTLHHALHGKRIVITRAAHQAEALAERLSAEGAVPLRYPAIEIVPPRRGEAFDTAIAAAEHGDFDWIIFTSVNAAEQVAKRVAGHLNPHGFSNKTRIAAIGSATAGALRTCLGIEDAAVPILYDSANLVDAVAVSGGQRVLLPQSEIAPPDLARQLSERGAIVTVVPAYSVITASGGVELPALVAARAVDAITFTSGSTVDHFLRRYTSEGGTTADLHTIPLVCMGQSAQNALHDAGFFAAATAHTHTLDALVTSLREFFDAK